MAIVRAVKSGNWSDTTVWNTGALPTAADDVYSNTFTVTIDQSVTVLSIQNGVATGVTQGGGFTVSAGGLTITCTGSGIGGGNTTTANVLTSTVASGQTLTIIGNIMGVANGGGGNGVGLVHNGAGTINITGNVSGYIGNTNTNGSQGVFNNSTGTINITGNVTGGGLTTGLNQTGVSNGSTGTVNITGSVTGGGSATGTNYGFINASTGNITHVGTVQSTATNNGIGAGAMGQVTILTGPLLSTDASAAGASASGVNPCIALRWFPADTALSTFEYRMRGQTVSGGARPQRSLYFSNAYDALYPAASNVRSGTIYGPGGANIGTCAVPPAASVLTGVPVDNTTGTAAITQADITSALTAASAVTLNQQTNTLTTPGSIGERLKLASTVATTAQQLSDALSNE